MEYICSESDNDEIINNYRNKIFLSAEKILNDFIKNENEYKTFFENKNKNDENIEKEYQEKEIMLKYYIDPLCKNIFPAIKNVKFYEDEEYKSIFCKIFLNLISSGYIKVRENIKNLLNIIFDSLYE